MTKCMNEYMSRLLDLFEIFSTSGIIYVFAPKFTFCSTFEFMSEQWQSITPLGHLSIYFLKSPLI